MKIRIFIMILEVFIFRSFAFSQNQWQYINDNPPFLKVYSADVIENTAYFWCTDNIVYKTSDAGGSFDISLPYAPTENTVLGCCDKHGISFADSNIGYIADAAHGEFRTTDGGHTWLRTENAGSNISLVEFGSENVGWKVGDGGLFKTTDAGNTWSFISNASLFQGGIFSNIFALDENNVWILKSFYNGTNTEGSIWQSSNGGDSWRKQQTDIVSSEENQIVYNDIIILSSGIGIAIGSINRPALDERKAFIQKTTDFGDTWNTTELSIEDLKKVIAVNDSVWIVFGNENNNLVQLKSNDYGDTWNESNPIESADYYTFYTAVYVPSFNSILVSTQSGMYKSTDQGETYSRISTELELYVKDVNFDRKPITSAEQTIIATSFNRSFLLSKNSGQTWEKKEVPAEFGYEIWDAKISEGTIYIIVDQTHLLKSTDYGDTWTVIYAPAYSAIIGLDVYDKNTLVVQAYQNLLTSFDGGATWLTTPFPTDFFCRSSFMLSPNSIISVGEFFDSSLTKGFIYKTSDNGFNWQIKETPDKMKRITMLNSNAGFAGSEENLYKTTNGGDAWEIIKSSNGSISAFCFRDTLNGLVHQGIDFYKTEDGGKNWRKVNLNFPYEQVDKIGINSSGNYFAVSHGNLLFSPYTGTNNNQPPIDKETKYGFALFQNNPNPFNPATNISFSISKKGYVKLNIYNVLGKLVDKLVNDYLDAGTYTYKFNAKNLSSGIYFYSISVDGSTIVKKMNYIK